MTDGERINLSGQIALVDQNVNALRQEFQEWKALRLTEMKDHEKRITSLERSRWIVWGIFVGFAGLYNFLLTVLNKIPWQFLNNNR